MTKYEKGMTYPKWVSTIEDDCLHRIVRQVYLARQDAIEQGAPDMRTCTKPFQSGERTLESIRSGKVVGGLACRNAATALRKYNTASECALPSWKRGQNHSK